VSAALASKGRHCETVWNEVRRSHQSQGPGRQTPNLGMLFSAKCKVRINLCAMVRSISL
jgi:hypothetical protein